MKHSDLVETAGEWLRRDRLCTIVLCEPKTSGFGECPDAIGWDFGAASTVVECKISRSDFAADRKKQCRDSGGMGSWRYFLTPKGLASPDEALKIGWGLVEVTAEGVASVTEPRKYQSPDLIGARRLLVSALARFQHELGRAATTKSLRAPGLPSREHLAEVEALLDDDPHLTAKEIARIIHHPGKTSAKMVGDLLRARSAGLLEFPLTGSAIK